MTHSFPNRRSFDLVVRRIADYSHYPVIERRGVQQEMLMSMVGMGFGISLVSEGWVALGIPGVVMRPLVEEADIVPFSAIWSPDNDNPVLRRRSEEHTSELQSLMRLSYAVFCLKTKKE